MRALLLTALAASSAACTLNEMLPEAPTDLRRYPRVLVLPFEDKDGLGKLYARNTTRGLLALGLSPVPAEQAEALVEGRPGALTAQDLAGLRDKTRADAVLSGKVDCGTPGARAASVSFILQETAEGRVVLKEAFQPKRCGSSMDVQPIAMGVTALFRRELERRAAEAAP
ncbi:MAG TPA: hypothetical protein DCM05_13920 [Elusimicrobia bacterium]|nr:hypothetical protein [Elusimicrobiota bacterium]